MGWGQGSWGGERKVYEAKVILKEVVENPSPVEPAASTLASEPTGLGKKVRAEPGGPEPRFKQAASGKVGHRKPPQAPLPTTFDYSHS